ncbi:MAG: hypothetical protein HYV17_08085 [Xanthomonadales bacterium]|nr:hypothetical protein [Xanthomonadales bacterium]
MPTAVFCGASAIASPYYSWSASSTGVAVSGYPASNVLDRRIYRSWKAPAGGSQTLTLSESTGFVPVDVVVVAAPAGRPMLGDITVQLRNTAGTILVSETLSHQAPDGLPDRRFLYLPEPATAKHVDVICAADSEVGRVFVGETYDMSGLVRTDWRTSIEFAGRVQANSAATSIWATRDQQERPRRAKRWEGVLQAVFLNETKAIRSAFLNNGRLGEIVWLPRVALASDSTGLVEMMHRTGIFGRFRDSLRIRRADLRRVESGFLEGEMLRTFDVTLSLVDYF